MTDNQGTSNPLLAGVNTPGAIPTPEPPGGGPQEASGIQERPSEQRRQGAFQNEPLPGEDDHRPFDLTSMKQVQVIPTSELVAIRHPNGRIEITSTQLAETRLAKVQEKGLYRKPDGSYVEGYTTDKGIVVHQPDRGQHVLVQRNDQFEQNFKKVK